MGALSATADQAPFVDLHHTDGARARVYLDGAQVASWIPAGRIDDCLFVSANATYGAGRSIRGGIPICFPQFGPFGDLPQHGFARVMRWQRCDAPATETASVVLRLDDTDITRAAWPHRFRAELAVQVAGTSLAVELTVTNTDTAPFSFTAALHPYFRVEDAFTAIVRGLRGARYRDALREGAMDTESADVLAIEGPLDRVYADTPDVIELVTPSCTLHLRKRGFPDTVVWNPGAAGTSSRVDFAPGDEQHMLCVEAGAIMRPVVLEPGRHWSGAMVMEAT